MLKRDQGKLVVRRAAGRTGRIQLFASVGCDTRLRRVHEALDRRLGRRHGRGHEDQAAASCRSSRPSWTLLAEARRPFPDKWHGICDVDMRFRQRYVDLWVTDEARRALTMRSRIVSLTRRWLEERRLRRGRDADLPSDPRRRRGQAVRHAPQRARHASCSCASRPSCISSDSIVGGFERVFEIGRVFRNEGLSPRHNPEFTMLELYQAYADYGDMMELVEAARRAPRDRVLRHDEAHATAAASSISRRRGGARRSIELVDEHAGVAVDVRMPIDELARDRARPRASSRRPTGGRASSCSRSTRRPPSTQLWGPVFVLDYPNEVSPLARDHREVPGHGRAIRGHRRRARAVQRVQRADRSRRAAGAHRSTRPIRRPRATTRRWRSTRTTSARSNTGCRPPAASASASTVS